MNPKVDAFIARQKQWKAEFELLRKIALASGLDEDFKWGNPCYSLNGKNVVLIHGFKEYCALLLFKGALLKDPKDILVQQSENVQSPRQIRFTSAKEITKLRTALAGYIKDAIAVEKAGKKVELKKVSEYKMAEEFERKLQEMPRLKKAFYTLTPGRQRGYLLYFSSAKQSKTRGARVEKYVEHILGGKGLDD